MLTAMNRTGLIAEAIFIACHSEVPFIALTGWFTANTNSLRTVGTITSPRHRICAYLIRKACQLVGLVTLMSQKL